MMGDVSRLCWGAEVDDWSIAWPICGKAMPSFVRPWVQEQLLLAGGFGRYFGQASAYWVDVKALISEKLQLPSPTVPDLHNTWLEEYWQAAWSIVARQKLLGCFSVLGIAPKGQRVGGASWHASCSVMLVGEDTNSTCAAIVGLLYRF